MRGGGACGQQNLWAVTEKPFPFGNGFFACEEGIRNELRLRWGIEAGRSSPVDCCIIADLRLRKENGKNLLIRKLSA